MNPGSPMRPTTPMHPHPPRPQTDAETAAEMDKVAELATSVIVAVASYWKNNDEANRALVKAAVVTVLRAVAEADK